MVISASLQACGVVFPFAMPTSICRSIVTICSGLYLLIGMIRVPPSGFSLIPLGTNFVGHVTPGNLCLCAYPRQHCACPDQSCADCLPAFGAYDRQAGEQRLHPDREWLW